MTDHPTLNYFLAENKGVLVVSLIGPLVRSNAHLLEKCLQEVTEREVQWVILNFRDVPASIDRAIFPTLTRFQKLVREKKGQVRLSSLHPDLRDALNRAGIVRLEELSNHLAEALSSLSAPVAKAA